MHGLPTSGSSLVFGHSFIFVSFKPSAAVTELEALPGAAANLLTSVEFSFPTWWQGRLQNHSSCMFMQSKKFKKGTLHISLGCFRRICREKDFII